MVGMPRRNGEVGLVGTRHEVDLVEEEDGQLVAVDQSALERRAAARRRVARVEHDEDDVGLERTRKPRRPP